MRAVRPVTACFKNTERDLKMLRNKTQFRLGSGLRSQSGATIKNAGIKPAFLVPKMLCFSPYRPRTLSPNCDAPGRSSLDSLSRNRATGRCPRGALSASALWISSDGIAATHPHRLLQAHWPQQPHRLPWSPLRHPYRNSRPTSCVCYLASFCSVNPLNKC